MKWSTEFPKKEGVYWFYGYRYGRVSCGSPCEPEWMIVEVIECSNGFIHTAKGQFMFEDEIEYAHFMPVILPEFPELND